MGRTRTDEIHARVEMEETDVFLLPHCSRMLFSGEHATLMAEEGGRGANIEYMTACGTNDMNRICTDRNGREGMTIKIHNLKALVQIRTPPLPITGHALGLSDLLTPFSTTASPIPCLFPIQMLMTCRHRVIVRGPWYLASQLF